jgi:hypothetical protein
MRVRRLLDFPYVLVRLRCDICKRRRLQARAASERLNCRRMSALNARGRRSPQAAPCFLGGRFTGQERAGWKWQL